MKLITLTQGKFARVDDEDFEWLSKFKWYCSHGYAVRRSPIIIDGRHRPVWMHREIANTPDGYETDHIDGNKLNNTRANLRICTHAENHRNVGLRSTNTSGYKGVSFYKRYNRWRARIWANDRLVFLGYFDSALEAACAYNNSAMLHYGEFAWLNQVLPK